MMDLRHLIEMFEGQDGDKHDVEVSLNDVREWGMRIARLEHEVHELKRTRSEAEAEARLNGFRDGEQHIIKQLRAYEINLTVGENL